MASQHVGETNLDKLLANMQPVLSPELFVFLTFSTALSAEQRKLLQPVMEYREDEGTTVIARREDALAASVQEQDIQFPCRRITLHIHSSLEAVGFLARITTRLASQCQMGVNPVSAFFHDHLFVPDGREEEAMEALHGLVREAKEQTNAPP